MITDALSMLYPDLSYTDEVPDVIVMDDGAGEYIAEWNRPEPQPTQQELEDAYQVWLDGTLDRVKSATIAEINQWRNEVLDAADLTESIYLDAQRTLVAGKPEGDLIKAAKIVAAWEEIERQYQQAANLVMLAENESEINLILERRNIND
jgi:hypothetical protein